MADFVGMVTEFETSEPIATPAVHADYLDNLIALFERWALMARQDADIAGTWLSKRKPKKGRRAPWKDRIRLSRRTRGHGRQVGDALMEAVNQIKKWRDVNIELEKTHGEEEADDQSGQSEHDAGSN